MSYQKFAYLYDSLMQDAPYDQWLDFFEQVLEKYHHHPRSILDVGCGTGAISIPLAQKGLQVMGVDVSEDMLAVAQHKSQEAGVSVHWVHQDMTQLSLPSTVDTILCFCDSINYILEEKLILATFQNIYNHLEEGGLFLFDCHSLFKMEHIYAQNTYGELDAPLTYLWQCYYDQEEQVVDHELSFFVQQSDGKYERFDEFHQQKAYHEEKLKEMLLQVGFEILQISADFTHDIPVESSERLFFVAKK